MVEDLPAALTVSRFHVPKEVRMAFSMQPINALISTSPCIKALTSVPGKYVIEVEEEEQNNEGSANHACLEMKCFVVFFYVLNLFNEPG